MSYATSARKAPVVSTSRAKAAVSPASRELRIGDPNDAYEQEADRVAEDVMSGRAVKRHSAPPEPDGGASLQRKCSCGASGGSTGECEQCKEDEEEKIARRKAAGPAEPTVALPIVNEVLDSPGQPLDPVTRGVMEAHFGHDFSKVRVHADARATESAQAINALAYTVGSDVVFGAGRYAPDTSQGKRLLAHELAHTIQQAPGIARQSGLIPAPPLDLGGPASKKAREYQPHFRPHIPQAPTISPPPVPEEATPPPGPCPSAAQVARELKQSDVASRTETEMERDISLGKVRAGRAKPVTQKLISEADAAIRKEFGDVLPRGRNFADPKSVDTHTPADFAKQRVPDAAAASSFIGQAALETAGPFLRNLCVTAPNHPQLQSEVAAPILKRRTIDFVRDHQSSRIGGMTKFPEIKGTVTPHVDLPTSSANAGHIVVHEAMHFYVSDAYRRTAEASKIDKELMEGGAEYLARQVINARLAGRPEFAIHYGTYAWEFRYVTTYLLRGGLSTFKQAYFGGHTDLLGLTPVKPKLAISQPGDALEREADRAADEVVSGGAVRPIIAQRLGHSGLQRQPKGATPALDPDDQKIVDAAQREASKFNCNVGPTIWGILRKHFPNDSRKVAGTACETALAGLRTEFSTKDPKDPKLTRSVPMIYAGKAFIAGTDAAHLKDRIADVANEIKRIDEWRLANFLIDDKDLSNPKITGPLRSMSATQLINYRDKTKDAAVKRYVDNLSKVSTPIQSGASVDSITGEMTMTIGTVKVIVRPDVRGAAGKDAGTAANLTVVPPGVPPYHYDKDNVVDAFAGYTPAITLEIVTSYPTGLPPETTSGYGRGTTTQDVGNKATGLRFHEGSHGEDVIDFVRRKPFPTFTGKVGMKRRDFEAAKKTYTDAVSDWGKALDNVKKHGDCVGKTIDQFHKGEKGYKNICP
ncbi:MAG TPA: DUF4157 domain-containing protein [Vicinamibacterales bacterium]|nr:DUF4157 domain-containing protein [Vicinamibacterales bacterium]